MIRLIVFVSVFVLSFSLKAQRDINSKIEGLQKLADNSEESKKAAEFFVLANFYLDLDSTEQFLKTINTAVKLAEKYQQTALLTDLYSKLGTCYERLENIPKSQYYFLKSISLGEKTSNNKSLVANYIGLGNLFSDIDKEASVRYLNKALSIAKKGSFNKDLAGIYNSFGVAYAKNNQIDSAEFYYLKSLRIGQNLKDSFLIGTAYMNLAGVYIISGDFSKSIAQLNNCLQIDRLKKDPKSIAIIYANLGLSYLNLKSFEKALYYFEKSNELSLKHRLLSVKATNYLSISDVYNEIHNSDSALSYYKLHIACKDSLFNIEKQKEMQKIQMLNQQEQSEKQIAIYRQKALIRNLYVYLAAFFVLFILILSYLLYRSFKLKLKLQEAEKNKMVGTIDQQNRDLTSLAMNLSQKKQLITEIESTLKNIKKSRQRIKIDKVVTELSSKFKTDTYLEHNWDTFIKHFKQVHPSFYHNLLEKHPKLSATDQKYCAFIKLNLGNKEIAIMNNINVRSVLMIRYRLKKKFGLNPDDDLNAYINQF